MGPNSSLSLAKTKPNEFKRRRRRGRLKIWESFLGAAILLLLFLLLLVHSGSYILFAHSGPITGPVYSSYSLGRHSTVTATTDKTTTTTNTTTTTTTTTTSTQSHSVSYMNSTPLKVAAVADNFKPKPIERLRIIRRREGGNSNNEQFVPDEQTPNNNQPPPSNSQLAGNKTAAGNDRQSQEAYQQRLALLRHKYMINRAIHDTAYYILLLVYSSLITFGTVSNSLICLTVILKPQILSPRNIFIVNLAYSDLLLCVFTMPFSFIEISMKRWQMGLIPCKLVAGLQATSIFVSTISITAIALDRYKVIVYPTHSETSARMTVLILGSVWIGALLLSSPLFCFRTVEHLVLPHKYDKLDSIDFCVEKWPFDHGRGIYSVISMIFQYVVPITIVCLVYLQISRKLKKRLIRRQRLTQLECQQKRQLNLIKRTHTMLVSVALVFILSWLPLNLLNLIGDFSDVFKGDDQQFRLVFAFCHLIGCSSACTNPILYGYLNENFRKELHQVYSYHLSNLGHLIRPYLCRLCCCWRSRNGIYAQQTPTSSSSPQGSSSSSSSSDDDNSSDNSPSSSSSSSGNTSSTSSSSSMGQNNVNQDENLRAPGKAVAPAASKLGASELVRATNMGKTMRFCLCVTNGAGSSSTETLGPQQQQQQQQQIRRKSSGMAGGKKSKASNQSKSSTMLTGSSRRQDNDLKQPPDGDGRKDNNNFRLLEDESSHLRGSSCLRREKRFRCKCQCHVLQQEDKETTKSTTRLSSTVTMLSGKRGGENNGFVCQQEQLRRSSKCSIATTTTASQQQQQQQKRKDNSFGGNRYACPSTGRRVWLRFWPVANNEPQPQPQLPAASQASQVEPAKDGGRNADDNDKDTAAAAAAARENINNRVTSHGSSSKGTKRKDQRRRRRASGTSQGADRQLDVGQVEASAEFKGEVDKQRRRRRKKKKKKSKKKRRTNTELGRHCDNCREAAAAAAATSKGPQSKCSSSHGSSRKRPASPPMGARTPEELGAVSPDLDLLRGSHKEDKLLAKQMAKKEGRTEGLEMDLMLVGPGEREQPSQFAGSLYLSVASRCGWQANNGKTANRKATKMTTKAGDYADLDLDAAGSRCSFVQEKSTSFLALDCSASFGISEQQQQQKQQPASVRPQQGALEMDTPSGLAQQQVKLVSTSEASTHNDNDNAKTTRTGRVQRREEGTSPTVDHPMGHESRNGELEQVRGLPASDLAGGVRVVIGPDRLTSGEEVKYGVREVADSGDQPAVVAEPPPPPPPSRTETGVQPEMPISGSASSLAVVFARPATNSIHSGSSSRSNSHSNSISISNSVSSSVCLTHSQSHWQWNSSASCTCSVVSSIGSSGRSSCTSQPLAQVLAATSSTTDLPFTSPLPLSQPTEVVASSLPAAAAAAAAAAELQSSVLRGGVGGGESINRDHHLHGQEREQELEQEKEQEQELKRHRHEAVSSRSSSPLEVELQTENNSSCSSSLRSWASLEVARLMAASSAASSRPIAAATTTQKPLLHGHEQEPLNSIPKLKSNHSEKSPNRQSLFNGFDLQPAATSSQTMASMDQTKLQEQQGRFRSNCSASSDKER